MAQVTTPLTPAVKQQLNLGFKAFILVFIPKQEYYRNAGKRLE
jgi:hypothetical protein